MASRSKSLTPRKDADIEAKAVEDSMDSVKEELEVKSAPTVKLNKRIRVRRLADSGDKKKQPRKQFVREDEDEAVGFKCQVLTDVSSESETPLVKHLKPRLRRRLKAAPATARNGGRLKTRQYPTRSAGVLPQLLRNGKRRKFKEPIAVDGINKRRRRLLAEGSTIKLESESEGSFIDASQLENGDWDSDAEVISSTPESAETKPPAKSSPQKTDSNSNLCQKAAKSKDEPEERSSTPDMNWETVSVNSTPSSKNFDASLDDISEKDFSTDCENVKDVRRSQRSSIRKTRAALLRLATSGKRGVKSGEMADDDERAEELVDAETLAVKERLEEETGNKEPEGAVKKPDEMLKKPEEMLKKLDEMLKKPEEMLKKPDEMLKKPDEMLKKLEEPLKKLEESLTKPDEALKKTEEKMKKPGETLKKPEASVSKVRPLINISPCEAVKIRSPAKMAVICKQPANYMSDADLQILRNTDLRRKRVKSLSTQDLKNIVDRGLFPTTKERRSSDVGHFQPPDAKKMKFNTSRLIKFDRILPDLKPIVSRPSSENGEPKSSQIQAKSPEEKAKNITSDAEVKETKSEAKKLDIAVEKPDKVVEKTNIAVKKHDNEVENTIIVVKKSDNVLENTKIVVKKLDVTLKKTDIEGKKPDIEVKKLEIDVKKPDIEVKKLEIEVKKPDIEVKKPDIESTSEELKQLNMEEEINQLEAKLREESSKESPKETSVMNVDIGKLEMAEKLREISMRFEDDSDIFPSLNIRKPDDLEESPEQLVMKESIFQALGLQSLEAARLAKLANRQRALPDQSYTGTLKTIIKLQRSPDKRTRVSKMKLCAGKTKDKMNGIQYSICKDNAATTSDEAGTSTANGVGNRKCLKPPFTYRSYFDISSNPQLFEEAQVEEPVQGEGEGEEEGEKVAVKQNLVIPEKASSFSIHPGRLCSDVCSYCFGKFGSLDTPCHIAQLKGNDRQVKILQAELHLTAESCLCDACYRHVDRKANCPSYREKHKIKTKRLHHMARQARPKATCCVQGCAQQAQHHVRRKWLTKLKRSIGKKVPSIVSERAPQHTPLPLCTQHYAWISHFMACGLCRRRLNCNQMFLLGPEVHEINQNLTSDRIPVRLAEKTFLCKLCRYFTSLRIKFCDKSKLAGSNKMFYESYRKKILQSLDVEVTEDPPPEAAPKAKKRRVKATESIASAAAAAASGSESPPLDLSEMVETQLVEPMVDFSSLKQFARPQFRPTKIRLKVGSQTAPAAAVRDPETSGPELNVRAQFDFDRSVIVRSDSEGEWERCLMTLQYDRDSKVAFEQLKRPYGSQSSFFKHMLLLEQYWRSGELVPSPKSNPRTRSYLKSVRARISNFSKSVSTPPAPPPTPLTPGSSSNPLFVSHVPPKKFVMNPATGQMVQTKRKPNIVQITKGGQPLFRLVDPTKSQLRALQGYKQRVSETEVIPRISDVRSLSQDSNLWGSNSSQKLHISIVPKPNTVVTPTGIVLSKKLDVSVVPVSKPTDSSS